MKIASLALLLLSCDGISGKKRFRGDENMSFFVSEGSKSGKADLEETVRQLQETIDELAGCNQFCLSQPPPGDTCPARVARVNELAAQLAANTNDKCTIEPPDTANAYDGFARYRLVCTDTELRQSQILPTMYDANVVLVGGGGSGGAGNLNAAGGGAGALVRRDVKELVEAEYFITIGAGGFIRNGDPDNLTGNGKDSVLATVSTIDGRQGIYMLAKGGGRGGGSSSDEGMDGFSGGSGGGAAGCLDSCTGAPEYRGGGSTIGGNPGGDVPVGTTGNGGGGGAGGKGEDGDGIFGGGGVGVDLSSIVGTEISRGPLGIPDGWFAGGGDADFRQPDGEVPGAPIPLGGGGYGCNSDAGLCGPRNYPGLDFASQEVGNAQGFPGTGGGGGGAIAALDTVPPQFPNRGGSGVLIIAFDACPPV